jgi:hypothetical protein
MWRSRKLRRLQTWLSKAHRPRRTLQCRMRRLIGKSDERQQLEFYGPMSEVSEAEIPRRSRSKGKIMAGGCSLKSESRNGRQGSLKNNLK